MYLKFALCVHRGKSALYGMVSLPSARRALPRTSL